MPPVENSGARASAPDRLIPLRLLAALALCALGFATAALLVAGVANPLFRPQRDTGMAREKLAELRTVAPQIDVLVVGTSRLLHGFDPRVFDAETARLGTPFRSYNLSLQRLLLWEQARVLDDALALPGFRPRLVLLEPAVGLGLAPENFTHARTLEFETPAAWRLAVSSVLGSERSIPHQVWNVATHSLVAVLHQLHYGLYTGVVFPPVPALPGNQPPPDAALRGFLPQPDRPPTAPAPPWLVDFARDHQTRFAVDSTLPGQIPAPMRRHYLSLRDRLRARGIEVLFVQPPQLGFTTPELRELTYRFSRCISNADTPPPLLSYLDPQRHPELFDPRWWADYNHYTAHGASLFTHQLARDVVRRTTAASR